MTNEEACKWLANLRQDIGNPHYECLWGYEQAICEIMSMLEEQGPVKPVDQGDDSYVCDNCGETVGWEEMACCGIDQVKFNYCPGCGRPVDWNG